MKEQKVDHGALLCALVLAPRTYSRNRFFRLYEDAGTRAVRRRASRVRGMIRQLTAPGQTRAEIVGEQVLNDGRVLIRYRVDTLAFQRTAALSATEAAVLRYALHRAGVGELDERDRAVVEGALQRLNRQELPRAQPA